MSKTARVAAYILIYILLPLALFSGKIYFSKTLIIEKIVSFYDSIGVIFRFSFTSFIYALLLLILPWFGSIVKENQSKIYLLNTRIFVLKFIFRTCPSIKWYCLFD